MHSKGIMHRDLKPENLLFRKEGEWDCVIADFGLAEFANIDTYLFVRCGTPGYVAPEVINIKDMKTKYSPICDIYSLGLIFHILLFGKSAFPGTTYNEVLAQNRAANIDLSGEEYKKWGEDAYDLLVKMLKKKPTERITADEALNHKYFTGMDVEYPESPTLPTLARKSSGMSVSSNSSNGPATCDSPLLTSANPKRRLDKTLKKDSCVDFKMGRDNVVTGRTE
jgi:serine/threonine protein kinase